MDKTEVKALVAQWLKEHSDRELYEADIAAEDANPLPLEDQLTENLAIYAGVVDDDEQFRPYARFLLRAFEKRERRAPNDYTEIEEWWRRQVAPTTKRTQ